VSTPAPVSRPASTPASEPVAEPAQPQQLGRLGPVFAGVWLFFLLDPLATGWDHRGSVAGVVGLLATVAFAVVYLALWIRLRKDRARFQLDPPVSTFGPYLAALVALAVTMVAALGETGMASVVYLAVCSMMCFPLRAAIAAVAGIIAASLATTTANDWGSQTGLTFGIAAAAVAIFGLRTVMRRNLELVEAHQRNAALAVENERSRFARDLHDILGHSLTVITVKAELAQRLMEAGGPEATERARAEVADLERLSRDALADVRRAVQGYRGLTLPGELVRARTALAAAGIDATIPGSAEDVPTELRELFAWAVREGVTNVVRHSRAAHCEIRLAPASVQVCDDGVGADATAAALAGSGLAGSGLAGLRERAAAAGATVVTRSLDPGFSLEVRA
jgi:two-component system sensor histidine kinase DesK